MLWQTSLPGDHREVPKCPVPEGPVVVARRLDEPPVVADGHGVSGPDLGG
jgi:hypothetical protein